MTIALKAARIFDGKSDRIETGGVVLIEGEEIAASRTRPANSGRRGPDRSRRRDAVPGFHRRAHSSDSWSEIL